MRLMVLPKTIVLLLFLLASCQQEAVGLKQEATLVTEPEQEAVLTVRFVESAPKDSFIFANNSDCATIEFIATVNLADTVGKLIFDTTSAGAGVEVFQPFEANEGQIQLVSSNAVEDGDNELMVRIASLPVGASVGFTIDVDDTLPDSELGMIRVSASEMSGGVVRIEVGDELFAEGVFNDESRMTLTVPCRSE